MASLNAPVIAGEVLVAGLRNDFWDLYKTTAPQVEEDLAPVMDMNVPSDKLEEIYGYFESAPYPRRWPRGQSIPAENFKGVQFSVPNVDWGIRVEWHTNDREDDQTDSLFERAKESGINFATLHERVFFQILTAGSDPDLLEAIPNAPDGVALYSTTNGSGGDRYGVTDGNLIAGSGVTYASQIRADFFNAVEQFRLMRDTKNQPLHTKRQLDAGFIIYFNAQNYAAFLEAFQQERTIQVDGAAGNANAAAGVTNLVLASGLSVELRPTQRITDNDWYIFQRAPRKKAVFMQRRQDLREAFATWENSDQVRDSKQEYWQADARFGYGILWGAVTAKINN